MRNLCELGTYNLYFLVFLMATINRTTDQRQGRAASPRLCYDHPQILQENRPKEPSISELSLSLSVLQAVLGPCDEVHTLHSSQRTIHALIHRACVCTMIG